MELELTEEQKMFQTAVRDFARKEIAPLVKEAEETETFPIQIMRKMGKLGYVCPGYPKEYGGAGLGKVGHCIMAEEVCQVSVGIGISILVQGGLGTYPIYAHGTEQQKQKYLVPAIRGEMIGAFGLTEPNAGSDAGAIQTTAQKDEGEWVINGNKIYISNSPICDFIIVAATVDKSKGTRGITVFIVDRNTEGLSITKMHKVGVHSSETGEVNFDNCKVPEENLIGEVGKGYKYMLETLNGARISHAARSVGTAQAAYEIALNYSKQRVQFGHPIGHYQAIAFRIASLATQIEAARSLTYRVAKAYDNGHSCRLEGPMAKLYAAEVAVRAVEDSMRILAGAGYLKESSAQRYFRDAMLGIITEGTAEMQQLMISRELGLLA